MSVIPKVQSVPDNVEVTESAIVSSAAAAERIAEDKVLENSEQDFQQENQQTIEQEQCREREENERAQLEIVVQQQKEHQERIGYASVEQEKQQQEEKERTQREREETDRAQLEIVAQQVLEGSESSAMFSTVVPLVACGYTFSENVTEPEILHRSQLINFEPKEGSTTSKEDSTAPKEGSTTSKEEVGALVLEVSPETDWLELTDAVTRHRYFANTKTKLTSWTDPQNQVHK